MGKRENRIFLIKKIYESILNISAKGKTVNKEKLIAALGIDNGIARRTALEFINDLIIAERIKEFKGELSCQTPNM